MPLSRRSLVVFASFVAGYLAVLLLMGDQPETLGDWVRLLATVLVGAVAVTAVAVLLRRLLRRY
ncbi:hypothetical protein [Nocardia sp. NPDC052566]|uniref:hypothetical protein n=1 Tax=Nocardia sp. NPDC052566 TaxID=3364330 RepID=UPI0037C8E21B